MLGMSFGFVFLQILTKQSPCVNFKNVVCAGRG